MNLQELIADCAVGFTTGLTISLTAKKSYETEDKIAQLEIIPEEERLKLKTKVSDAYLVKGRNVIKNCRVLLPLIPSLIYSEGMTIISGDARFAAVPAAYLGGLVGRGINHFNRREKRQEIELMKKVAKDPENAEKYLLSEEQNQEIKKAFLELEERIFEEGLKSPEEETKEAMETSRHPVRRVYDIITENPKPYTGLLLSVVGTKQGKVMGRAKLRRDLRDFYEMPSVQEVLTEGGLPGAIIGYPEYTKIKAFIKEGDELVIKELEWTDFRSVTDDKKGLTVTRGKPPKEISSQRYRWAGDYRQIAEEIQNSKDYTIIAMISTPGTLDRSKHEALSTMFFAGYASYQEHKRHMEESKGKK